MLTVMMFIMVMLTVLVMVTTMTGDVDGDDVHTGDGNNDDW